MTSEPAREPAGDIEGYLQRGELLAELGRYDEAATEINFAVSLAPADPRAPALLARIHLAAGRPAEALAAAEAVLTATGGRGGTGAADGGAESGAVGGTGVTGGNIGGVAGGMGGTGVAGAGAAGDPVLLRTQVVRGLALADLRRFGEAARVADEILTAAPADAYAQRSGAAILADSRNGQPALNAAWRGVELAPREAQAHLVLSLVCARLGLFDLAERAYREALELDSGLAEAARDVGVIRLERRRYAAALEDVAESTVPAPRRPDGTPPRQPGPATAPPPHPDGPAPGGLVPDGSARGGSAPGGPPSWAVVAARGDGLRRLILYGAGYVVVAAVAVAWLAGGNAGLSRVVAALAAIGGGALLWVLAARTPGLLGTVLPALLRADRALALAGYAALAGPVLILGYALVGSPWPLVLAIAVTAVAELVVLRRSTTPPRA